PRLPHSSGERTEHTMSPVIEPLPTKNPKISSDLYSTGTSFAIGLPRLVRSIVVRFFSTSLRRATQRALNVCARTVFLGLTHRHSLDCNRFQSAGCLSPSSALTTSNSPCRRARRERLAPSIPACWECRRFQSPRNLQSAVVAGLRVEACNCILVSN